MDWDAYSHLRAVVHRSFSPEARIVAAELSPHLLLVISWRLGTDPLRPSKRSKVVQLLIEEEAIQAYASASAAHRNMADQRLEHHIQEQLLRFNPDHQTPLGKQPPSVRWTISAVTLLG